MASCNVEPIQGISPSEVLAATPEGQRIQAQWWKSIEKGDVQEVARLQELATNYYMDVVRRRLGNHVRARPASSAQPQARYF